MKQGTVHSSTGGAVAVLPEKSPEREQVKLLTGISTTGQKRFGRYEVLRLIGEGAMGKVFLARDPVLHRQVAIKVIAVDTSLDEKKRLEYATRFSLEAKLSAQLNHQSIVPVYDAGEETGVPWIAFQFIDGVTLDKILKRHGKLSLKWAVHIAFDIASALQQAHHIHVVHRDIKPANIIIERNGGIAKLTDFGVAKTPWAALTCEGNAMGSPGYMSPEQIEGYAIDERSDLFSFGVVLYEMITGVHPFYRDSVAATAYAIIGGAFTPVGEVVNGVPPRLDSLIKQCLATSPEKRIASATHCIDQLRSIRSEDILQTRTSVPVFGKKDGIWHRLQRSIGVVLNTFSSFLPKKNPAAAAPPLGKTWTSAGKPLSLSAGAGTSHGPLLALADSPVIHALSRALRRCRKDAAMLALGAATLAGLFMVNLMLSAANGSGEALKLPLSGLNKSQKALVAAFHSLLRCDNLDSARTCAEKVIETTRGSALGQFMLGVVACSNGDYGTAFLTFEEVRAHSGGMQFFTRNRRYMVRANVSRFEQGRAPDGLVMVLAKQFNAAEDPLIKKAVYDKPYWPRWNALRIIQAAGKQIDLVRIFMLDLAFADNVHTRIQAARDLGELGDRRAVQALKKACAKGESDEFVAAAAAQSLKDILKE